MLYVFVIVVVGIEDCYICWFEIEVFFVVVLLLKVLWVVKGVVYVDLYDFDLVVYEVWLGLWL